MPKENPSWAIKHKGLWQSKTEADHNKEKMIDVNIIPLPDVVKYIPPYNNKTARVQEIGLDNMIQLYLLWAYQKYFFKFSFNHGGQIVVAQLNSTQVGSVYVIDWNTHTNFP